jgi:integrase
MGSDSEKLSKLKRPGDKSLQGGFGLSSAFFGVLKTKNSQSFIQLKLITRLLEATGMRISEALSIGHDNFSDFCCIDFDTRKGGNKRHVQLTSFLWKDLFYYNWGYSKKFDLSYNYVYRQMKKMSYENKFIKNDKNYSITHFFRKNLIRKMFYEYKNPVPFILNFFGWKSKKSLLYYL